MVLFDIPYAFLAGGAIGWRAGGGRRDLALTYGAFGIAVPGTAYLEVYPGWDWQYLVDPATTPAGTSAAFAGIVMAAAVLGHVVGARRPKLLVGLAALLSLYLVGSLPTVIHVGDAASWAAGGGFQLPWHFLLFSVVLMGASGVLFAWCWHRAARSTPFWLWPHERLAMAGLARVTFPDGVAVDEGDLLRRVERLMRAMPWDHQLGVRLALAAFDGLAVLRLGRPFGRLSAEKQAAWLDAWAESRRAPFRLGARLLLTVVKPCHVARREVTAAMEFPAGRHDDAEVSNVVDFPVERMVTSIPADREVRCEVVVVGTGAGGAVVAAELAQRGVDVVLVEEGRLFEARELGRDPLGTLTDAYRDGGSTVALGRPSIPMPLGNTVGGTTTVNSGTCFRVPEAVLGKWDRLGIPLNRDEMARRFARVEARISVQALTPELLGGSSTVIARGAEALGLSHRPLSRNIKGCQRSGVCAFGCPRNAKQSMNVTYVPDALHAGATLYTGLRARRVLTQQGRAVGIEASAPGGGPTLTVRADAVVAACGSIWSVPFLHGSGVRNPHLGRHLTIHPAAKIAALMPEQVDGWDDTPQGYCIDAFAEDGIMFEGAFVPPEFASIAFPFVGRALTDVMSRYRHLAMFGFLVADEPSGRVRARGGRPVVTYRMSDGDLEKVRRGLRTLSEVFFAAGAERIYLPVGGAEEQPSLDAALKALDAPLDPWALELAAFHPLGTARMATSARDGVLDPDLQTWAMRDLYVVDGSVFPTSLGVNPQLTIMAMATRAAEHLAERFA